MNYLQASALKNKVRQARISLVEGYDQLPRSDESFLSTRTDKLMNELEAHEADINKFIKENWPELA